MQTITLPEVHSNTKLLPPYKVLLHNDDVNDMNHVVNALVSVFGFTEAECVLIMLEAHKSGCALCKTTTMEAAEFYQEQLQAHSLTATIEPE